MVYITQHIYSYTESVADAASDLYVYFYRINYSNSILIKCKCMQIFVPQNKPNRFQGAWQCMSFSIDRHQAWVSVTIINEGTGCLAHCWGFTMVLLKQFSARLQDGTQFCLVKDMSDSITLSTVQCFYLQQDGIHVDLLSNMQSYRLTCQFCLKECLYLYKYLLKVALLTLKIWLTTPRLTSHHKYLRKLCHIEYLAYLAHWQLEK